MFINVIFQLHLVIGEGFGFFFYFYVIISLLPVELFQPVYALSYIIVVKDGVETYPHFLFEVITIHLFISLKYNFPYGGFLSYDKGDDLPFRTVFGLHLDILKETHLIDISKVLIERTKVELVPDLGPYHGQDGIFLYAVAASHLK